MGALRWNERMRGEKPAVWLHWVGKDPVEICNHLPHPDEHGELLRKFFGDTITLHILNTCNIFQKHKIGHINQHLTPSNAFICQLD